MAALMGSKLMRGKRGGAGLRALGLGVAVLLGVSACSGPPETPAQTSIPMGTPTPLASSPTAIPSGSPTASSSPSNAYVPATSTSPAKNVPKPVLPKLAKEKSFEGQKAFIKYWFETYNYAFDTGNTAPFKDASTADCAACKIISEGAITMWTKDRTWRDTSRTDVDLATAKEQPPAKRTHIVDARVNEKPGRFWTTTGESKLYQRATGGSAQMRLWIEYVDKQWRTVDMRKIGR
ncbi:DUF6318 family protein [Galactobacter caseinivorans]|nr:DUF6318 family protein [Galactobacter caseinivorans]